MNPHPSSELFKCFDNRNKQIRRRGKKENMAKKEEQNIHKKDPKNENSMDKLNS
jgi:hypothetical protein